MGLAIIAFDSSDNQATRFRMTLGTNRYWTYAIGDGEPISRHGIKILKNRRFTSPIMGPLSESSRGRGMIEVPNRLFDRRNQYVQLMSFRDRTLVGPAISDIYQVLKPGPGFEDSPVIEFSKEFKKVNSHRAIASHHVDTAPCNLREIDLSEAMFLNMLGPAIQGLLPQVGNLLGPLLGGGKGGAGGIVQNLLKILEKPDILKTITGLFGQAASGLAGAKSYAVRPVKRTISLPGYMGPANNDKLFAHRNGSSRHAGQSFRSRSLKDIPYPPGYAVRQSQLAQAQALPLMALIPMIAKLLPTLMPAITKVLDGVDPNKAVKTVTESVEKIGKLGLEGQKQLMGHLEKTLPKLASESEILKLMESLSVAQEVELPFRRIESVKLSFPNQVRHMLYGTSRVVYRYGQDLSFPLNIETPRTIGKAVLQLVLKNARTLEILDQKKWPVQKVGSGSLGTIPRLPWSRLSSLKAGDEYIVQISLTWKNKAGNRVGTSHGLLFRLAPDYSFDHVEESGELLPLNDPTLYREFWHKVWQTTFTHDYKRQVWHCKYYYTLESERTNNAYRETLTRLNEDAGGYKRKSGKLKSGMILSPNAIVQLIPRLNSGDLSNQMPNEDELAALMTSDFKDRFNQVASTSVKFRGKDGQNVALWTYPVVKMQRVVLKKISAADQNGQVLEMIDHPIYFPIPVMAQFIGLSSE